MDSVSSTSGMGPEIYAMKKAVETQTQGIMKLLDSADASSISSNMSSGASVTGIGQTLDIKA